MAIVNGVVGQQTITEKSVIDERHPAIVRFKTFKADSGIIKAGEIIALDAGGDAVSFDPASGTSTATPIGVNAADIDTSKDTIGSVVVHGTVVAKSLLTQGSASTAGEIATLESSTLIWSF